MSDWIEKLNDLGDEYLSNTDCESTGMYWLTKWKCSLLAAPLYPTMCMTSDGPSTEACKTGKARGLESCLKCERDLES